MWHAKHLCCNVAALILLVREQLGWMSGPKTPLHKLQRFAFGKSGNPEN